GSSGRSVDKLSVTLYSMDHGMLATNTNNRSNGFCNKNAPPANANGMMSHSGWLYHSPKKQQKANSKLPP
ncbi:MAG TPA: hypothetical protein VGD33_04375, partial [Chitinophagaceae bacterium]